MAADILIISLIASYCIFLFFNSIKMETGVKAPGCAGCGGNCGSCSGCATSAGKTENKKM